MAIKHMVAVASGKGGVGKSTITAGLGLAAVAAGLSTGILDADLHGYSIPRMLGGEVEPWFDDDDKIHPGEASGIKLVSMGYFVRDNPVIWRAPLYIQALEQFMNDFQWGDLDLLLLDLPPGTGDMPLNVMQRYPQAKLIVVTTPQPTAAEVAARVAVMAGKMQTTILGVVENMSWFECGRCKERHLLFGSGGGGTMAKELNVPLLGQLPLDEELREAADAGQLALNDGFVALFGELWPWLNN